MSGVFYFKVVVVVVVVLVFVFVVLVVVETIVAVAVSVIVVTHLEIIALHQVRKIQHIVKASFSNLKPNMQNDANVGLQFKNNSKSMNAR